MTMGRLLSVLGAVAAAAICGCSSTTEPFRMRVVDFSSGEPITGAVAVYELHSATGHGTNYTQHTIHEAVSDDAGWVHIPAQKMIIITSTGLRNPTLTVFKNGYVPAFVSNPGPILPDLNDAVVWQRDEETLRLRRPSAPEDFARSIDSLNDALQRLYYWPNDNPCGWMAVPRAILALEQEAMQLEASRKRRHNSTVLRSLLHNEAIYRGRNATVVRCGSPTEFFAQYPIPCPNVNGTMEKVQRRSRVDETSGPGTSVVLFTLGYCPSDGRYWLHEEGAGWNPTGQRSLDFIQDRRRP